MILSKSLDLDPQLNCILFKGIAHSERSKEKFGRWLGNRTRCEMVDS